MKTISICVPLALQSVQMPFVKAFSRALMPNPMYDMAIQVGDPSTVGVHLFFDHGFPVDVCRNNLVRKALDVGSDYVFWVDADQVFNSDLFSKLLKDLLSVPDADVMSGLYCQRLSPYFPVAGMFETLEDDCTHWFKMNVKKRGIFKVEVIGMGACVMTGDALRRVSDKGPWFLYQHNYYDKGIGRDTSEDIYFCGQARKAGVNIYVNSKNLVGHLSDQVMMDQGYKECKKHYNKYGWPKAMTKEQRELRGDIEEWPGS